MFGRGYNMNIFEFYLSEFPDELDRELEFCPKEEYDRAKNTIDKHIVALEKEYAQKRKNFADDATFEDVCLDEFQMKAGYCRLGQYRKLCQYMQGLYAAFENQVAKYCFFAKQMPAEMKLKKGIDFKDKYPVIYETNHAVNVIKHGEGETDKMSNEKNVDKDVSYKTLVEIGSKFVAKPTEFNIDEGPFTSYKILNIEYADLERFVDEAKRLWRDITMEYIVKKDKYNKWLQNKEKSEYYKNLNNKNETVETAKVRTNKDNESVK